MEEWIRIAVWGLVSALRRRRDLALENMALRQQLGAAELRILLPRFTDPPCIGRRLP